MKTMRLCLGTVSIGPAFLNVADTSHTCARRMCEASSLLETRALQPRLVTARLGCGEQGCIRQYQFRSVALMCTCFCATASFGFLTVCWREGWFRTAHCDCPQNTFV